MIERIDNLSSEVLNIIIYTNNGMLKNVIKEKIKKRYGINPYVTHMVYSTKELKDTKLECQIPPFGGGIWLIDVDTSKIPMKEVEKSILLSTDANVTIYWIEKYADFKKLIDSETIKANKRACFNMYLGKLEPADIYFLHDIIVPTNKHLKRELLVYLEKNYTYDVNAVCELYNMIKSGEEISTQKDIVEKVGLGGNTVDSVLIKLLTSVPNTELGSKKQFNNIIKLLEDLSHNYEYSTIRNFMLSSLDIMVAIKYLQLRGEYNKNIKEIPDIYKDVKFNRLRRFENVILEDIPLPRILNLISCLKHYNSYEYDLDLTRSILLYLDSTLKSSILHDKKEVKKIVRRKKKSK